MRPLRKRLRCKVLQAKILSCLRLRRLPRGGSPDVPRLEPGAQGNLLPRPERKAKGRTGQRSRGRPLQRAGGPWQKQIQKMTAAPPLRDLNAQFCHDRLLPPHDCGPAAPGPARPLSASHGASRPALYGSFPCRILSSCPLTPAVIRGHSPWNHSVQATQPPLSWPLQIPLRHRLDGP